ncbi:MAG: efflux RND transporter periplasmic adaptor subunit [Spirochaetales bacterium]|nr:efflux RND transporter periplasmic adaptor subunit [Spirochaetales bacterium]
MSVKKIVYLGFLPLLPLILLLNSGFLLEDGSLENRSPENRNGSYAPTAVVKDAGSEAETSPGTPESVLLTTEVSASPACLYLSGEVRPKDVVDIFPDTQGKVRELRIEAGDPVASDQVLAMIDPSRPGMNYTLSPVKSSIRGTVTAVYTDTGAFITPGQPICSVGTLTQLEVDVYIPEGSIDDVRKGMTALAGSPVLPDLNETLVLNRISPVLDPVSRSMKVVFIPESRNTRLKAGMFIDLMILLE